MENNDPVMKYVNESGLSEEDYGSVEEASMAIPIEVRIYENIEKFIKVNFSGNRVLFEGRRDNSLKGEVELDENWKSLRDAKKNTKFNAIESEVEFCSIVSEKIEEEINNE